MSRVVDFLSLAPLDSVGDLACCFYCSAVTTNDIQFNNLSFLQPSSLLPLEYTHTLWRRKISSLRERQRERQGQRKRERERADAALLPPPLLCYAIPRLWSCLSASKESSSSSFFLCKNPRGRSLVCVAIRCRRFVCICAGNLDAARRSNLWCVCVCVCVSVCGANVDGLCGTRSETRGERRTRRGG